jgi:arylsulfatase A-like enzyme
MDFFPDDAEDPVRPKQEIHLQSHREVSSPAVTSAAVDWLASAGEEPFFLFLHYFDVHYDFVPPPEIVEEFDPGYKGPVTGKNFLASKTIHKGMPERDFQRLLALYDGEIRFVDNHIGLVLEALREKGRMENTVIVITGDHGEEFFEHGEKGHRNNLFETVIRIPLIFRLPGGAAGRRISGCVRILDIGPTLLDLAGIAVQDDARLGKSLLPWLKETGGGGGNSLPPEAPEYPVFSELVVPSAGKDIRALRRGRYKGIWDRIKGQAFFYDLQRDPAEQNPLLPGSDPVFRKMEKEILDTVRDLEKNAPRTGKARLDSATIKRLKTLGYVE